MNSHPTELTPEEEGRQAARQHVPFNQCPYTYQNSGVRNMDEYAATGNNAKRDQWFQGWLAEVRRLRLNFRFEPL